MLTAPVDFDQIVELLGPGPSNSLVVARERMMLREAVERVLAQPVERLSSFGIGLHAPIMTELDGRPVLQGYLSGHVVREAWGEPAWPMEHAVGL